jgi:hypothetical protein
MGGFFVATVLRVEITAASERSAVRAHGQSVSCAACGDVNIVGLKNAANVGPVRGSGAQPLDRRFLVAESFEKGKRKILGVKRLLRQFRNGLFYLNRVQLRSLPSQPLPCPPTHIQHHCAIVVIIIRTPPRPGRS